MSDTNSTDTPVDGAVDTPVAGAGDTPAEPDQPTGGREARYRIRAKEAEAERDALRQRLDGMLTAEAERIGGTTLSRPAALWASGTTLADVLADDGTVDPAKVTDAATRTADALGVAPPTRTPMPDPSQGATGSVGKAVDQWADAFAPPR